MTKSFPIISSRWKPGHVIRIDTQAGSFEEINAPLMSIDALNVQTALLPPLRQKPASTPATQTAYNRSWQRVRAANGLKAVVHESGRAPDVPRPALPRNPWVPFFAIVAGCLLSIVAMAVTR